MGAGWIGIPGLLPYAMKAAPSGAPTVPGLEFRLLNNNTQFKMRENIHHSKIPVNLFQFKIPKDK